MCLYAKWCLLTLDRVWRHLSLSLWVPVSLALPGARPTPHVLSQLYPFQNKFPTVSCLLIKTSYLKKKNEHFSAVLSVPWAAELWHSDRLCYISKNNLPFCFSSGKCEPMQLAILADIWILNKEEYVLAEQREITEAVLRSLLVVVIISIYIYY